MQYLIGRDAKMQLFDYLEVFYNQRRRHSTIGYVSARCRSVERKLPPR